LENAIDSGKGIKKITIAGYFQQVNLTMLNVTKSFLPDIEEYIQYLRKIWGSGWLTNHGPLVLELEEKLRALLGVKHFFYVNNGTIAIQIALKAIGAIGEVITTPFSYVATTSSIVWEGCKPVFADIDPQSLCIAPDKVRALISPKTSAILAVHVYGTPCAVEELHDISKEFNIPVIYDAAHAFGVKHNGTSVLNYGAISTLSFHATKVFHTVEGGAIITNDDELAAKVSYMRNFGHDGPTAFQGLGINGKVGEINAAMGLANFPYISRVIASRRAAAERYDQLLRCYMVGDSPALKRPRLISGDGYNYSYYPVIFRSEDELIRALESLKALDVLARRYFYPTLNTLPYVDQSQKLPVAEDISRRVLCLPLFPGITDDEQDLVVAGLDAVLGVKGRAVGES
jgi:dTDP-4-amino-4,6-dideoxygalactose transaminase